MKTTNYCAIQNTAYTARFRSKRTHTFGKIHSLLIDNNIGWKKKPDYSEAASVQVSLTVLPPITLHVCVYTHATLAILIRNSNSIIKPNLLSSFHAFYN